MKIRKTKIQLQNATTFAKKKKITLFESEMPQKIFNETIKPKLDYTMKKHFGFNPTPDGYYVRGKFCFKKFDRKNFGIYKDGYLRFFEK